MKNKFLLTFIILIIGILCAGCRKVPQEKIDAFEDAIAEVQAIEADLYVHDEYSAFMDFSNEVKVAINASKSKFLFKNVGNIIKKIDEALKRAKDVKDKAVTKKNQIGTEVKLILTELIGIMKENTALVKKAPRGKEGSAVLEQVKTEMSTIEDRYIEAKEMYDRGAFMDALIKVKAITERATGLNTELKDAILKIKGRL